MPIEPGQGAGEELEKRGSAPGLARRLGLFDSTMIVMGGIVGSGIFINPYVVAREVHTPALILGAWALGGVIALAGAFAYAELAALRPEVGGQYAYLREAYHPAVAFVYGWALLLVTQSGGMAAVAVTFAHYVLELTRAPLAPWLVATLALGGLTLINCLGVRAGSTAQSVLMVTKIAAIAALVGCGWLLAGKAPSTTAVLDRPPDEPRHRVLNIGAGHPESVAVLIETLETLLGVKAKTAARPKPASDVSGTFADVSEIKALTGYAPKVRLAEGLGRFVAWYRDQSG